MRLFPGGSLITAAGMVHLFLSIIDFWGGECTPDWPRNDPLVWYWARHLAGQDLTFDVDALLLFACVWLEYYRFPDMKWPIDNGDRAILAWAVGLALLNIVWTWRPRNDEPAESEDPSDEAHSFRCGPMILPARTSHSRMFPTQHSFSYSYLQVLVPVGFSGKCGQLLSVGNVRWKGWFHVSAADYLNRNSSSTSLKTKLSEYLNTQGVNDSQWSYAYLSTAPRFLGYSFNPVSFWYIYDAQDILKYMILEVNNTFDERRPYLLEAGQETERDEEIAAKASEPAKFRQTFTKDFHVSPFSSRKGHYKVTAADPFAKQGECSPKIDSTIVLNSSKNHAKLIARLFSEGPALDPSTATFWQAFTFIRQWFWVGFFTSPRIIKEAGVLFFRKGLNFWYRPEVMPTSTGRSPAEEELNLEAFFSQYLEKLVQSCPDDLTVSYDPRMSKAKLRTLHSPSLAKRLQEAQSQTIAEAENNSSGGSEESLLIIEKKDAEEGTGSAQQNSPKADTIDPAEELKIEITSPAFFSRLIHYSHISEAFDREGIFTDEKNRTISISSPKLLAKLLEHEANVSRDPPRSIFSLVESLRWTLFRHLRCPPAAQSYPTSSSSLPATTGIDIRAKPVSSLDRFVRTHCADSWSYRRQGLRLFFAQRFTLGFTQIIDLLDLLIRILIFRFAFASARWVTANADDVLALILYVAGAETEPARPKNYEDEYGRVMRAEWPLVDDRGNSPGKTLLHTAPLMLVPLWAFVKGYRSSGLAGINL